MGLLRVNGLLDVRQLWPTGSSDADTLHVKLRGARPFAFAADGTGKPRATDAFVGAYVRVKGRKEPVIGKGGVLRVRLQGVDAPELHYRPASRLPELRQAYAESATRAMAEHLRRSFGRDLLECRLETRVAEPNDVFDMYARFIGDVLITHDGHALNLNQWLVEQGWALPSFYNSMTNEEIRQLTELTERARAARTGVWKRGGYTTTLKELDRALTYRKPGSVPRADAGPLILPKLFRRQYMWWDERTRGTTRAATLREYLLEPVPSKRDKFVDARKFLADGAKAPVHDLGEAIRSDNRLGLRPEWIVFLEAEANLCGPDGKIVRAW